jgi:hypothetical protein
LILDKMIECFLNDIGIVFYTNMVNYPNRLFKGWCSNEGNKRSNFLHYHI